MAADRSRRPSSCTASVPVPSMSWGPPKPLPSQPPHAYVGARARAAGGDRAVSPGDGAGSDGARIGACTGNPAGRGGWPQKIGCASMAAARSPAAKASNAAAAEAATSSYHMQPFDLAAAPNGIAQAIQTVTDDAVIVLALCRYGGISKLISSRCRHICVLQDIASRQRWRLSSARPVKFRMTRLDRGSDCELAVGSRAILNRRDGIARAPRSCSRARERWPTPSAMSSSSPPAMRIAATANS
jgi:hypothetical protein